MTDIVQEVEGAVSVFWKKLENWWNNTAVPELQKDEQELLSLLHPIIGQAEAAAVQDLQVFVTAILTQLEKPGTLQELETVVLNALGVAKSGLLGVAQGLGSAALQALIALILAKLGKTAG